MRDAQYLGNHVRHCERSGAIHLHLSPRKTGLLRRFAPRNDGTF
ncbi:MAG: hypothetical protein OJF48_004041 [Afipia sp.]|nr:MAG: hypothetical protein OJF48_004041 [Afipia sp.]